MIIKIINLFFGNNPKQRFKRLVLLVLLVFTVVFFSLQVSCGFDKSGNFYFWVSPAAKVDVNVKK